MEKRRLGRLAWSVVTLAASSAFGQVVLSNSESTISGSTNEIGGKVAYELLTVSDERPTLILRYGQLKSGSEIIVLDGRTLARDREYSMDYVSGVVYLKVAGKSASVQYRYDEAKGTTGTFGIGSSGTKFQGYTFQLNRNAAMVLGMGLTERLANGTVLSSNVYGLNNSFSFGRGKSTGVFLVSDRKQVKSTNLFGDKNGTPNSDLEGKSEAIIQQAELSSFGGKWLAYYQSIGEKFGGLSALEGAGFAQDKIQQFSSERGLKRTEFQAQNIGGKGLALGAGLKSIGDETGSIVWRNSTVNLFGAHIDFSVFKVDPGFSKFNNIAETDRQQLSKERGMERRSFNASKSFKGSKWAFESSNVETVDGPGIYRRKFEFSSSKVSTSFSDQHVVKGFNRFGDLREADRDQLARESGLVRQAASLQLTPSKNQSLNAGSSTIRTDTGDFAATSIDIKAGKVSLSHSRVDIGQGFSNLGSMRPDEINGHVS
ncbi:MAG: hypothetical protein JNM34_08695, partial [Chthonomonadaceae bacterium]|nr:hypothetical protein [Chthonomonadaceae bacterium]